MKTPTPTTPPEALEALPTSATDGGPNPYYTPTIMAAFRVHKERQYGGQIGDDVLRMGTGEHSDEPYYTEIALQFRHFKAGAEWMERFCGEHADERYSRPLPPEPADLAGLAELSEPDAAGSFPGDIWFGHPEKRTLGTHRWDGAKWSALPSEADVLVEMLAAERAKVEAANRLLCRCLFRLRAIPFSRDSDLERGIEEWRAALAAKPGQEGEGK